ncbi:hypothetical protein [Clostridium sp. VAP52]|uniref:hypothetical protein n=1 Tax=Clostridium sp. VAP52 TaxID=2949977 RepID=UPI00207A1F6F|nr:hypothetical protein [Clostridium sp. VAP52]
MCNLNSDTYKNESIKEFQNKQQTNYLIELKNEIISDIKTKISENPYIENIKYEYHPCNSIYNRIKREFKTIGEELKKENINLIWMKEYKTTYTGFLKKKENKILNDRYYLVTWK